MDKQKQIEEMARELQPYAMFGDVEIYEACDTLYNAGYRKITEGAVLLTGTETKQRLEDLLIEFDEMSFYPATLMPNAEECAREWKNKLIYAIGQLYNEVVMKFAERLKPALQEWLEDNEDLDGTIDFGVATIELIGVKSLDGEVIAESLIDEIAKELTGGER